MMLRAPRNASGSANRIEMAVATTPRKIVMIISPPAVSQNVSNWFCGVRIDRSHCKRLRILVPA